MPSAERTSSLRHPWIAPLAVYVLLAVLFTWPLVFHFADRLAALSGPGDPYLNLWILGWDLQTMLERPRALLTGAIFNAPIFHPARQTLAYSDHLILPSLAVFPVYALTRDVVLCYNVLFFAALVASAWAMHAFARAVTGSQWGAYAAGLAWGFWPYRFAQLPHLQVQALYLLPLGFLALHRLVAGRRRRDALALGLLAALQACASVYIGVIGAIALAGSAIALAVAAGRWRDRRLFARLLLAAFTGAVLLVPVMKPYWDVQRREGFARNLYEAGHHSASAASWLSVPDVNLLYGRTGWMARSDGAEEELFPGFALIALAAAGGWFAWRRDSRPVAASMIACVALGGVLAFGPNGARAIYAAFHRFVFGFQAIRAPARFGILVAFGLAGLAAVGMRELAATRWGRRWPALPALALALMTVEYLNGAIPYAAAPARHTPVGAWLRDAPEPGAVVHLPLSLDIAETPAMLVALEHRRPLVNGYSGHRPAFYTALAETLSQFPSADAFWTLHELDARFIVSRVAVRVGDWPLVERARLRDPDGEVIVYELRWTPEVEARLALPSAAPPPPPGPAPFRMGERAVYRVFWHGAGRSLSAGEATIDVAPSASAAAAYRFVATATTAPWVSRFFEARDRFETTVDEDLLPLVHERHLREGRRTLDRVVRFDHDKQLGRVGAPGPPDVDAGGMTFRLPAGTRDPIAAFYYARTLTLNDGDTVRVPLNDMGGNYTLELKVGGVETIELNGQRVSGRRLEPKLLQRVQRRRPIALVAWLSTDERKIPLAVEVAAGFGALRIELVTYEAGK